MTDRPRYILVVEALPDGVPAVARLRRLLKHALRALRLKAVSVEEERPAPSGEKNDQGTQEKGRV